MNALKKNSNIYFKVDEALSDASIYKSITVFGRSGNN